MRPVKKEEITLFALMGQALLCIQVLEECLSVSITLKTNVGYPPKIPEQRAQELLKVRRSFTFGKAIKEAAEKRLYTDELQTALSNFREQRNWLVHKSIDAFYEPTHRELFAQQLRKIAFKAHEIQRAIELDLISFGESLGQDMSPIREAIRQWDMIPNQPSTHQRS